MCAMQLSQADHAMRIGQDAVLASAAREQCQAPGLSKVGWGRQAERVRVAPVSPEKQVIRPKPDEVAPPVVPGVGAAAADQARNMKRWKDVMKRGKAAHEVQAEIEEERMAMIEDKAAVLMLGEGSEKEAAKAKVQQGVARIEAKKRWARSMSSVSGSLRALAAQETSLAEDAHSDEQREKAHVKLAAAHAEVAAAEAAEAEADVNLQELVVATASDPSTKEDAEQLLSQKRGLAAAVERASSLARNKVKVATEQAIVAQLEDGSLKQEMAEAMQRKAEALQVESAEAEEGLRAAAGVHVQGWKARGAGIATKGRSQDGWRQAIRKHARIRSKGMQASIDEGAPGHELLELESSVADTRKLWAQMKVSSPSPERNMINRNPALDRRRQPPGPQHVSKQSNRCS